jgi:hypothetical protein
LLLTAVHTLIATSHIPFFNPYAPVSHFTLPPPSTGACPLLLHPVSLHTRTWPISPGPLAPARDTGGPPHSPALHGPRFRLRPQRLNTPSARARSPSRTDSDALHLPSMSARRPGPHAAPDPTRMLYTMHVGPSARASRCPRPDSDALHHTCRPVGPGHHAAPDPTRMPHTLHVGPSAWATHRAHATTRHP